MTAVSIKMKITFAKYNISLILEIGDDVDHRGRFQRKIIFEKINKKNPAIQNGHPVVLLYNIICSLYICIHYLYI